MPPLYTLVEHACGAIAFLGAGTPSPDNCQPHAPQVLATDESLVVLVSPDLAACVVADAFKTCCEAHDDPRARAVALKLALRDMTANGSTKFSFVLVDYATARVFAASTAASAPIAAGHAADGTLLLTCTRSGARAATVWPPRWAQAPQTAMRKHDRYSHKKHETWIDVATKSGGQRRGHRKNAPSFGASPPGRNFGALAFENTESLGSAGPVTPERQPRRPASPASTERSRSRSPGASSTHSACTEMSDSGIGHVVTTPLQHLPAGRFVYGRQHLQPFEFSAFWGSAESTRAGARATRSPTSDEKPPGAGGGGEIVGGRMSSHVGAKHVVCFFENKSNEATTGRARFSETGSRGDAASSWRKTPPSSLPVGTSELLRAGREAATGTVPKTSSPSSKGRCMGIHPETSPSRKSPSAAPPSFRAALARTSEEAAGSPTRGGLTRAFASSAL